MTPEQKKTLIGVVIGVVILSIIGYFIYTGDISLPSTQTVVTVTPPVDLSSPPVTILPVTPIVPKGPVSGDIVVKNFGGVDSGPVKGSLKGNAYVDTAEQCVRLTDAINGQSGALVYESGLPNDFDVNFTYRASRGTVHWGKADAIYFFWNHNQVPANEPDPVAGCRVIFREYDNGYMGIFTSDDKVLTKLVQIPYVNTTAWTPVRITCNKNLVNVYWNGAAMPTFSAILPSPIPSAGTKFGFGSRTGAANNIHQVNNIEIKVL